MNFYLVDDDITTRTMLGDIIEDNNLGVVIGQANDGASINDDLVMLEKADILLIDLLMPTKDGIETVSDLEKVFFGKIIMISQVVSKNMISLAYEQGIEYYIMKPLNKFEIVSIIKKVIEKIQLENSILNIHQLTRNLSKKESKPNVTNEESLESSFSDATLFILGEIGIIGESGYIDILDMLLFIYDYERKHTFQDGFPNLKDVYIGITENRVKKHINKQVLNKEIKSAEQRVRRAIDQSLSHLASLGLTDYLNPTFERYASKLFNFTLIRERMAEIKNKQTLQLSNVQVNTRKFIQSLYFEVKQFNESH